MSRIPIALQLYSIREDCAKDLPGTLKAVAEIGYEGVEFAGYHDRSAEELRQMCDGLNLKIVGTHIGLDTLLGDELEKTVEFNQTMGNKYLIVPGLAEERRNSRAAWLETAGIFDEIAAKVAPHGMQTGYHNHHIEFAEMDGELPWDTFFGNTRKEVVMQLDTGNMYHGGAEPVRFLEKYPGAAGPPQGVLEQQRQGADRRGGGTVGEGVRDLREHRRYRVVHSRAGVVRVSAVRVRGSLSAEPEENGQVRRR